MFKPARFAILLLSTVSVFILVTFIACAKKEKQADTSQQEPSAREAQTPTTETPAQPALADKTYAGLKFGLSKQQASIMFRNSGVSGSEDDQGEGDVRIIFNGVLAPLGNAIITSCSFCDDKLWDISLLWHSNTGYESITYKEVKNMLMQKYGNPNNGNDDDQIENQISPHSGWKFDNGNFVIDLGVSNPEKNSHCLTLTYENASFAKNCAERTKESSKGTSGF